MSELGAPVPALYAYAKPVTDRLLCPWWAPATRASHSWLRTAPNSFWARCSVSQPVCSWPPEAVAKELATALLGARGSGPGSSGPTGSVPRHSSVDVLVHADYNPGAMTQYNIVRDNLDSIIVPGLLDKIEP